MSEIKPPKHVHILGRKIKIKIKDLDTDHGHFVLDESTIYLSDDENKKRDQWPTLLHEMIHAALGISGVSEVLGSEREEAVCRCIESLAPILTLKGV